MFRSMTHPRQLISRNYHHLENHPTLAHLFPRKNLIGGTRRSKSLPELLFPIVQYDGQDGAQCGDDSSDGGGGGCSGFGWWNGSYHCPSVKSKGKCDVCSDMKETSYIHSKYLKRKFAIHGHNVPLPAGQKTSSGGLCTVARIQSVIWYNRCVQALGQHNKKGLFIQTFYEWVSWKYWRWKVGTPVVDIGGLHGRNRGKADHCRPCVWTQL